MAAHPNVRTLRSLEQSLSKGLALFLMADGFTEFHSTTFGPIISFFETALAQEQGFLILALLLM